MDYKSDQGTKLYSYTAFASSYPETKWEISCIIWSVDRYEQEECAEHPYRN